MKLFDIFAELRVKGINEAKKQLNDVSNEAEKTGSRFSRLGQTIKNAFSKIKGSLNGNLQLKGVNTSIFTASLNSAKNIARSSMNSVKSYLKSLPGSIKKINMKAVGLSAFKASLNTAKSAASKAASAINSTLGKVKNSFSGLKGVLGGLPGLLAGVGVSLGAKAVFDYANNLDQARINWKVLTGSAEEGEKMLQRITEFAKKTPFDFDSTQKFAQQLKIAGLNGDALFKTMQVIGDAAQGNAEKAEGIATAYSQMSAKGKIQTEEMNQLLERGIPAWDMLAKATGKSKAELMDMASKGKLLADEYLPQLVNEMDKAFGGGMQEQAKTFSGQLSTLEDNLLTLGSNGILPLRDMLTGMFADINAVFDGDMSLGDMFSKWAKGISSGLEDLGKSIAEFDLGEFIKSMIKKIEFGGSILSELLKGFKKLYDGIIKFFEKQDWNKIANDTRKYILNAFKNFDLGGILASIWNEMVRVFRGLLKFIRDYDFGEEGAYVGKLIREALSKVGDFLSGIDWGSTISALWESFITALDLIFVELPLYFANLISGIFTGMSLSEIGDSISEWFSNIGEYFSQGWESIKEWFSNLGNDISESISNWWSNTEDGFSSWWSSVSDWFSGKWDEFKQWFTDLPQKINEAISTWWDTISVVLESDFWYKVGFWIGEKIGEFIKFFIELPGKIAETVSTWWSNMVESFTTWWSNLKQWISEKFEELVKWFKELPEKISQFGIWIWNGITGSLASMWQRMTTWVSEKFNQLIGWFKELPGKIADWGTRIWNGISGSLSSLWGTVTTWFSDKFNQLVGWFREAPGRVAGFGSWLWNSITGGLSALWSNITSIGKSIVEGVWNGISNAAGWFYGQVKSFFSGLVNGAKSALGINSPSRIFRDEIGHWIPAGIAEGVDREADTALKSITNLSDSMQNVWQGNFDTKVNAYGNLEFDSTVSGNPFNKLATKFDELSNAFANIQFTGTVEVDGEKLAETTYKPLNMLIEEGVPI